MAFDNDDGGGGGGGGGEECCITSSAHFCADDDNTMLIATGDESINARFANLKARANYMLPSYSRFRTAKCVFKTVSCIYFFSSARLESISVYIEANRRFYTRRFRVRFSRCAHTCAGHSSPLQRLCVATESLKRYRASSARRLLLFIFDTQHVVACINI